jgi:hypothetical protein
MDPNDNFNALSRYPLNHTPYRSQSSMLRSPFQSSSFQTPQHGNLRPQKTCSCKCTCTPASRQSGCPSLLLGQNDLPTSARKRAIYEYSDKENQSPGPSSPPPKKQKRTYTKRRTIDEKLSDIFTVIDKRARTQPIWRKLFLQLVPQEFKRWASSTAMTQTRVANVLSSFDRSPNPGELNCSGERNTILGSVSAFFHISSPRSCASWIVSELITRPVKP